MPNGRVDGSTNIAAVDPLEHALFLAAEAGRFDVLAALAKEIEARRLVASNVTSFRSSLPKWSGRRFKLLCNDWNEPG